MFVCMKNRLYIIVLFLSFILVSDVIAQNQTSVDSVRDSLKKIPEQVRLNFLNEQINENQLSYPRLALAHLLRDEAIRQGNDTYLANAYFTLARHFYSANTDSMRYWVTEAEPLFIRLGRYEDICRMKTWDIYLLARAGDKKGVLAAVEEMKQFSKDISFPEGIEMADQAMANFYFLTHNYAEGEELYLDVIERMEKRDAPLVKKLNILRQLFLKVPSLEKRMEYIRMVEESIEDCKSKGIKELDKDNPLYLWEYIINRNYAQEYLKADQPDKAWRHLKLAEAISDKHNIFTSQTELPYIYQIYHFKRGEYEKSYSYMVTIEKNLRERGHNENLASILPKKAEIQALMKDWEGSNATYKEYIHLNDSINRYNYEEQLAEVRTKYQVEKLEKEKLQMEIEAKKNRLKLMYLFWGCVLLITIILTLIYLIRVIQRSKTALKQAKEKAEEADYMKSAFLANMNHEIRTPLNAIVGFSQVLVEEEDAEARQEYSDIIQNNNELLQRLISDILDISKLESNSISLIYSEQDIPKLMKELYSTVNLRMSDRIKFILDPCEPFSFQTDKNRLAQILTNLLINAIKYTKEGYIRFGYKLSELEIIFYVEDTGEGIEESRLPTIFDRFVQLETGKKGVGLGLAISKGLVIKMGGKIWVESEVSKGTTFYVSIPKNI